MTTAEHHNTGSGPGKGSNYVLEVRNEADVLTDRFYLYDSATELLGPLGRASVFLPDSAATIVITALDLTPPVDTDVT